MKKMTKDANGNEIPVVRPRPSKEQLEARQAACSHRSRASRRWEHSAFAQLSIDSDGRSLMRCTKCGAEKTVTVNAIYLTDQQRYRSRDAARRSSMDRRGESYVKKAAATVAANLKAVANMLHVVGAIDKVLHGQEKGKTA